MHQEVAKLLALQELDGRLEILRRELANRPQIIAAQDSRVLEIEKRRTAVEAAVKSKKIEIDKMDLELKTAEARIQETRAKVTAVKTNAEYSALMAQVARIEEDKGRFEERLLGLWEELEGLKRDLAGQERAREEAKKILEAERKEIEAEVAEIEAEIGGCQEKRRQAVAPIDREVLATYARLYERYRDRTVVSADARVCAGCHMTVAPQILNLLHNERGIVNCTNCARILYL
ncbi:MAG: C4-type zinc ribbon domain-containing protein [Planctomycetes bacterium]|nr:C4-type zinc ribbon domain-containing protein [Planctomycetota bacterium]